MTTFNANIVCSEEFTRGLDKQLICFSVVNIIVAFTTIAANTLILIALPKVTSIHPPSKVLLRNLIVSDLCVGDFYFAHLIGTTVLFPVSLWTITAISVDRLLALILGLRYKQVVTVRRAYVFLIVSWVCFGIGIVALGFYSNIAWEIFIAAGTLLCLMISIYCYTRIFLRLRNHQAQAHESAQGEANERIPVNITRYKKTVSTTVWLQLALIICFLPYGALSPFTYREIQTRQSAGFFLALYVAVTLMFFNSTLNPVLYCWKMNNVRQAVKDTLRQLVCSPNQ